MPRRRTTVLLLTPIMAGALALGGCAAATETPAAETPASSPAESAPAPADGAAVSASLDEHAITVGDGPVEVALWTDLSCPYCAMLEAETGELISSWVANGDITFTIHPLNFVSEKHGDATDWSTRAAGAIAAVADAGEGEVIPAFYALLQENQPGDAGAPTDDDIVALAKQAGVTADISDAVASQQFGDWVRASNDHWLGTTIDGTTQIVQGVPVLVVDGTVFDIQDGNADRLQAAVDAALAS
ncbi:thioredoxin domain-containing protein [Microbacterium sp. KR10-403]|uniref:DsbA family protein n=1 Tax=Microbacterium sp. KR10-403 TaxID=3158581 RepID=UPI0032E4134B